MKIPWYLLLYIRIRIVLYAIRGGFWMAQSHSVHMLEYGDKCTLVHTITVKIGEPPEGIEFNAVIGPGVEVAA